MKKQKKLSKKKKVIMIVFIICIFSLLFPIKFTKHSIDSIDAEEFYIVEYISEGSTDGGSWIIIGSHDGMWADGFAVNFTGKSPKDILSYDICNNYTKFIIYGSLDKVEDEYYTLKSERWGILGKVRRGGFSLRIPFKHYITIYDLNWFDFLLTDKGYE